ncbi:MAG TPA: M23 family metallopeptidase [Nocardioidaceae bacterium]|nr:M23 family metallopeptidase [Nocardioidaceae bacterium]
MWQNLLGAALAAVLVIAPSAAPSTAPSASPDTAVDSTSASAERSADDDWRFWVRDKHRYTSPWYAGAHRKMISYGCTRAPYYAPDPRCTRDRGFHHGVDIAMRCGTRLFAGFGGRVVHPDSAGALGAAYGRKAFRLRNHRRGVDVVIGHVRRVYVEPGDRVRKGDLVARASDDAAPDGCHLHFEVRPVGSGYQSAVRPHPHLKLRRR